MSSKDCGDIEKEKNFSLPQQTNKKPRSSLEVRMEQEAGMGKQNREREQKEEKKKQGKKRKRASGEEEKKQEESKGKQNREREQKERICANTAQQAMFTVSSRVELQRGTKAIVRTRQAQRKRRARKKAV